MNTAPQRNTYADLLALPEHVIGELIGGLGDPCPSSIVTHALPCAVHKA